jgi:hypothetical protein
MRDYYGPEHREELDKLAFPLAVEAVIGASLREQNVTEDAVHKWIEAALSDRDPGNYVKARAMYFAQRIIHGPRPFEDQDGLG